MKKYGFTMAEILLTLGIIGVVAAVTLPNLINNTQAAQVGPRLGKAASMFEQANQALLDENNVDSLTDAGLHAANNADNVGSYMESLSNHLKILPYGGDSYTVPKDILLDDDGLGSAVNNDGNAVTITDNLHNWISKDGTIYNVIFTTRSPAGVAPHRTRVGRVIIDINGMETPNLPGSDLFEFVLMNDGSLTPVGSTNWDGDNGPTWRANCANNSTPTGTYYFTCTASIFENNMKVMYKMR